MSTVLDVSPESAPELLRGRRLEYLTIGWNVIEAAVALVFGAIAGSVSLVGFGIDSVIECLSAVALLWRLRDGTSGERRERVALRLVGVCFLLLAAYVAVEAIRALASQKRPETSPVGVALASLSLIVMPLVAPREAPGRRATAQQCLARRRPTDRPLCAAVRDSPRWTPSERPVRLVVGRLRRRPPDGTDHRQEGMGGLRGETCSDCHG